MKCVFGAVEFRCFMFTLEYLVNLTLIKHFTVLLPLMSSYSPFGSTTWFWFCWSLLIQFVSCSSITRCWTSVWSFPLRWWSGRGWWSSRAARVPLLLFSGNFRIQVRPAVGFVVLWFKLQSLVSVRYRTCVFTQTTWRDIQPFLCLIPIKNRF